MIDGFWILRVLPPPVTSGGVTVFSGGKVFGGDNAFTWIGRYTTSGNLLKAQVRVSNFDPSVKSILEVEGDYELYFTGTIEDEVISGTAMLAQNPTKSLGVRFERRSDL